MDYFEFLSIFVYESQVSFKWINNQVNEELKGDFVYSFIRYSR